jgi:hypothetical protein
MSASPRELETASPGGTSQLLFRQLNEQICSIAAGPALDVVCECVDDACFERLVLPLDAYEAVRRFPTRFVVKEGHASHDVEREVEGGRGFVVVEKSGVDAEQAIVLDPRRPASRRLRPVDDDADRPLRREVGA